MPPLYCLLLGCELKRAGFVLTQIGGYGILQRPYPHSEIYLDVAKSRR